VISTRFLRPDVMIIHRIAFIESYFAEAAGVLLPLQELSTLLLNGHSHVATLFPFFPVRLQVGVHR
jgi:hypothetical protein